MRISQKLEYACRALAYLARVHSARVLTRLEEIAQREAVSANFLVQIMNDLRRGGLVESRRGKEGGYLLARDPETISLWEIVEVIDPDLIAFSTSRDGESGEGVSLVWRKISTELQQRMRDITLDQMSRVSQDTMFYI